MNANIKPSAKVITLLLVVLFSNLLVNKTFAQGPNAPEAASFEPVDAADMVNLITGDFTYVLPLLNVPSPEGGYPITLSYHGGIAMDQDASWVGLGWSLNPGAINRSVSGFPDDWGRTEISDFFYDQGWVDEFYDFSVGGTLPNGLTIGVGVSWDSNKSFGGSVTMGYAGNTIEMGTDGAAISSGAFSLSAKGGNTSFGVGHKYKNFQASISNNGFGIGYRTRSGVNVGLNHNFNSGLTASVGYAAGNKTGVGLNFSSNGVKVNGSIAGSGGSFNISSSSVSNGDWDIQTKTTGFHLGFKKLFWISFSKTRVQYSLFKIEDLEVSGSLYPYKSKELRSGSSNLLKEENFMDVIDLYDKTSIDAGIFANENFDRIYFNTNVGTVPSYDNYVVNAQGLSGVMKPKYFEELSLHGRGSGDQNPDNLWKEYVANAPNSLDDLYDLGNRTHFYFDNSYNSFLRIERSNIIKPSNITSMNEANALALYTQNTGNFSQNYTPSGDKIRGNNYRKREGNFIETYTNLQIRNNLVNNFIEAEGFNRSANPVMPDEGIGAYRITSTDGKIYHYSLPVYNFERVNKNFRNKNNEFENFFESDRSKPYATHWLLTAITGPDYYDKNDNGKVDEGDYGYWVAFEYGKWSDGYGWRSPKTGYNTIYRGDEKETHSYSMGRKQIYYLDAIKTRTHTALFVKDVRKDAQSNSIQRYDSKWLSGNFNLNNYKSVSSEKLKKVGDIGDVLYDPNGNQFTLGQQISGTRSAHYYMDLPVNSSMALAKIILLKNEDVSYDKSSGNITTTNSGYFKYNQSYNVVGLIPLYKKDPFAFEEIHSHLHQNILDVKDIEGLNLESKSVQVIDFDYDYSAAINSPNSSAETGGRLTLKEVDMLGRGGAKTIPAYKFGYFATNLDYKKEDVDVWGYRKDFPFAWSLNQIHLPTGGSIAIEYESDEFKPIINFPLLFRKDPDDNLTTGRLVTMPDTNGDFFIDARQDMGMKIGDEVDVRFSYHTACNDPQSSCFPLGNHWSVEKTATITQQVSGTEFKARLASPFYSTDNLLFMTASYDLNRYFNEGGIRVKNIVVSDGANQQYKSSYEYEGGVAPYIPLDDYDIPLATMIPAPVVTYKNVTLKSHDINDNVNNKTVYEFEVLEPLSDINYEIESHIDVVENQFEYLIGTAEYNSDNSAQATKYTISDKLSNLGRLKSISNFNTEDQLISKTANSYKQDLDADGEIGVTQESFKSVYKSTSAQTQLGDRYRSYYVNSISIIDYPSVLSSTSSFNRGITNTTYFDKHDFLTGELLETRSHDGKGELIKSRKIPAYLKYSPMGSKSDNLSYKNMLSQEVANYTYLLNANSGEEKVLSGVVNTWSDQWSYLDYAGNATAADIPVWRKHKIFIWNGEVNPDDGSYLNFDIETDDSFNWGVGVSQSNPKWVNIATTTRYDHFSAPIESKDVNGNFYATKMGDDESKIIAQSNSKYTEMFYSGAEYLTGASNYFDGQVGANGRNSEKSHTGNYSVKTGNGLPVFQINMKANQHHAGKYRISVWVDRQAYDSDYPRVSVNGTTKEFNGEIVEAGDWVQLSHYEQMTTAEFNIHMTSLNGVTYFDDIRVHPIAASMTNYVYNDFDELWYVIAPNGLSSMYEYDAAGKMIKAYAEVIDQNEITGGFKLVSKNSYNYKLEN